jgi:hypothetical protein
MGVDTSNIIQFMNQPLSASYLKRHTYQLAKNNITAHPAAATGCALLERAED